jgi:hypothetical protein
MSFWMTKVAHELKQAGREVGPLAAPDPDPDWFAGLLRLVAATGKSVDELTIGELRALIEKRTRNYNRNCRIIAALEEREVNRAKRNAIRG